MASVTSVNSQITDAVTQANLMVLAAAPAQALGAVYQVMAQAVGLSMQNAVAQQQRMNAITSAVTSQGVNLLYAVPTASSARGVTTELDPSALAALLAELRVLLQTLSTPRPES